MMEWRQGKCPPGGWPCYEGTLLDLDGKFNISATLEDCFRG